MKRLLESPTMKRLLFLVAVGILCICAMVISTSTTVEKEKFFSVYHIDTLEFKGERPLAIQIVSEGPFTLKNGSFVIEGKKEPELDQGRYFHYISGDIPTGEYQAVIQNGHFGFAFNREVIVIQKYSLAARIVFILFILEVAFFLWWLNFRVKPFDRLANKSYDSNIHSENKILLSDWIRLALTFTIFIAGWFSIDMLGDAKILAGGPYFLAYILVIVTAGFFAAVRWSPST